MTAVLTPPKDPRTPLQRRIALTGHRLKRLDPVVKGLLWSAAAGLLFSVLNALMRGAGAAARPVPGAVPALLLRPAGAAAADVARTAWRPTGRKQVGGQFTRGALHTLGLCLWFTALPQIPLADMTAIGFTGPIFIMIGAYLFFKEPMRWERWLAAGIGFAGVLIVVGPKLSGSGGFYNLVMLASAPMFAASFLLTKALTRYETTGVILVWQSLTVTLFSLPLALLHWQAPTRLAMGRLPAVRRAGQRRATTA